MVRSTQLPTQGTSDRIAVLVQARGGQRRASQKGASPEGQGMTGLGLFFFILNCNWFCARVIMILARGRDVREDRAKTG
jgi:hypothetical protein